MLFFRSLFPFFFSKLQILYFNVIIIVIIILASYRPSAIAVLRNIGPGRGNSDRPQGGLHKNDSTVRVSEFS